MNLSLFFAPHPTSYTPPANGRGPSAPAASAKSTFSYLGLVSARYNRSVSQARRAPLGHEPFPPCGSLAPRPGSATVPSAGAQQQSFWIRRWGSAAPQNSAVSTGMRGPPRHSCSATAPPFSHGGVAPHNPGVEKPEPARYNPGVGTGVFIPFREPPQDRFWLVAVRSIGRSGTEALLLFLFSLQ